MCFKTIFFVAGTFLWSLTSCDANPPSKQDIESAVRAYYDQRDEPVIYEVEDVDIINIGSGGLDSIRWQVLTVATGAAIEYTGEKNFTDTLQLNFYRNEDGWNSITVPK